MKKNALPFGKNNLTLMIVGIVLVLGGFVLMSMDSAEFGFGTLGLTVGPALQIPLCRIVFCAARVGAFFRLRSGLFVAGNSGRYWPEMNRHGISNAFGGRSIAVR